MNPMFNNYIEKIKRVVLQNPITKAFTLLKDFVKINQMSKEDLKRAAPNSYKEVINFRKNFIQAVKKDMAALDKAVTVESVEKAQQSLNESKEIYNEKFDIGTYIQLAPVVFYTFAFLIFIGEERYEKFKVKLYAFLGKTLGKHFLDR